MLRGARIIDLWTGALWSTDAKKVIELIKSYVDIYTHDGKSGLTFMLDISILDTNFPHVP